jgi:hypothetical protein
MSRRQLSTTTLRIEITGITKRSGLTEALPSSRSASPPPEATTVQREQRRFPTDRGLRPKTCEGSYHKRGRSSATVQLGS